ncbi:IpaD/SipD/SspD family type III secretion system needle tip protein [Erwinia piriflorinigrans]|uniref:Cell invasion protein sipD n=1 Tax=Erwinia piriflorinigrans CFBP 5888 TaxID=1161919 RepID=V5Z759_9GAMM|nr:IpaD/SipD/SspD family type III secretion system needle tip protein [Erwinia piriflorinigrans]CCG87078.1 Cell invasion protein sipD [Erwinia piriflorinigrans CFBP 5888]
MIVTMIMQPPLIKPFPEINTNEKQQDSHLKMEGILNDHILLKCLAILEDGGFKIEKLKRFLNDSNLQGHVSTSGDVEKIAQHLKNIPVIDSIVLDNQKVLEIIGKQNNLVDVTFDTLRLVKGELYNDTININRIHDRSKRALENQQAVSFERELTTRTSYADLWGEVAVAIGGIKSDYVDFYSRLMSKYLDMYQSYNKSVQKASSAALSTGDDGNNVKFNNDVMRAGYEEFNSFLAKADLGSVKDWNKMSVQEKDSMKLTLDPAFEIDSDGKITFNMRPYLSTKDQYPKGEKGQVPVSIYNAWLAQFNAAGTALQSNMQSFSSRYSQANSTYDILNKVFSETISRMADNAKDFLR